MSRRFYGTNPTAICFSLAGKEHSADELWKMISIKAADKIDPVPIAAPTP